MKINKIFLLILISFIYTKSIFCQNDSTQKKMKFYQDKIQMEMEIFEYRKLNLVDSVIMLDSTNFKRYFQKAKYLKNLKLYDKIIEVYNKVLKFKDANLKVDLRTCYLELGETYLKLNNKDLALKYYNLAKTVEILFPIISIPCRFGENDDEADF